MADQGTEIIQNILHGLQIADARKARQATLAIEQQRANTESEAAKARAQEAKDRLAEELRQHNLAHDIAQQTLNLNKKLGEAQISGEMQKIGESVANTGVVPAGATLSPAATSPQGGNYTPINPQAATSQTLVMPGGQQLSIPTPQGMADVKRTLMQPEIEASKAKIGQEQAARLAEIKEQGEQARLTAESQKSWQMEIARMQRDSAESIAKAHDATLRFTAQLPYSFFAQTGLSVGQVGDLLKPYVEGMYNGSISPQDLKADFAAKGMAGADAAVMGAVTKAGGVPLNPKQVQTINSFGIFPQIIKNIDDLIDALPKTPGMSQSSHAQAALKGLTTLGDQNISVLKANLESQIGRVALVVGGDQGQRLQKALLSSSEEGYQPSRLMSTDANIKRRNNFVETVKNILDTQLRGVPDKQKQAILNNLGAKEFTDRPMLQNSSQAPSSSTGSKNFTYQKNAQTGKWEQQAVQ